MSDLSKAHPRLTAHLTTEDERKEFMYQLGVAEPVLQRLAFLMAQDAKNAKPSKSSYEQHNWSHLMADWLGYERATIRLLELMKHLDHKEYSDHE